jgi:peptide/nickel transport system substrate-binding protein
MKTKRFARFLILLKSRYLLRWGSAVIVLANLLFLLSFPAQAQERELRAIAPWEIKGADPSTSGIIFQRMEIVETLTDVDFDGNQSPGLATEWTVSDDKLLWRFTLRTGVKYHDGTDLTPESVAKALRIALKKPGMLEKMPIKTIDHDGNDIRISLSQPSTILDSALSHYSACILSPAAYGENGEVKKPVGTGPYCVTFFEPPQKIKVKAFENYWGKAPAIKAAQYLAVARNETRALMAQSGDADIIFTLDPVTMKRLERNNRISVASTALPRTIVIKLNCSLPGLDKAQLRKALSDGLDRQGMALTVMRYTDASAYQLFPQALGSWHLKDFDTSPKSPKGYKELLTASGWKEDNKGFLKKDGKLLEMTLVTYSDRPELPVAATALQDQMRNMGIKLNVSIANSSAIPQGHSDGSLEMGLLARNYGLISNPLGTILLDYGTGGGDWGAMNWESMKMQRVLLELQKTSNKEKQALYIHDVSRILHEEMPTIPVLSYLHTAALTNDLLGFSLDPLERSYRISDLRWKDDK